MGLGVLRGMVIDVKDQIAKCQDPWRDLQGNYMSYGMWVEDAELANETKTNAAVL